uniref:No apical meristem-associated C-terminal domain-containing protein n=1 Tax=Kalanchoe fedtschenkoi TaxID=63787 RepID=A0A7N0VIN6_KALFE
MPSPFMGPSPNQPMEENSEDASNAGNEAPHNVAQQEKNSRHVKWSAEDEEMLISSWLTISNDSAVGNSQTRGSFWARVNEFNGYYNQIVSDHHSGWSDNQIIEEARLIWKNAHKKREFPYTHVWEMVKDEPKWATQVGSQNASKKKKTKNTYEGNESESHLIGQKVAKQKMRGKEKKNITESTTEDFAQRWKRMEELQAQKLAVLNEIKNKAKDDTLRADYEILMKDTSTMSDQQLIIHNHMCSIIKARHGIP